MAAAAHDRSFAAKVGMAQSVAKKFNRADAKTGILRKKKPKDGQTAYGSANIRGGKVSRG